MKGARIGVLRELSEDNPIKYAGKDGNEIEGSFLEISEPTGRIAHLVAILKSEIGAATKKSLEGIDLSNIAESDTSGAQSEEVSDGAGEIQMLMMGGADMKRVMVTFKEILRETALLAGEKQLTEPMFNRMAYGDVESCLGQYIGNFMTA